MCKPGLASLEEVPGLHAGGNSTGRWGARLEFKGTPWGESKYRYTEESYTSTRWVSHKYPSIIVTNLDRELAVLHGLLTK